MIDIAKRQQNPKLINHHAGVTAWEKLYLLIGHLGRRRVRRGLAYPPPPPEPLGQWDGSERRRRTKGTRADRANLDPNDPTYPFSRCSDDRQLIDRVRKGSDW